MKQSDKGEKVTIYNFLRESSCLFIQLNRLCKKEDSLYIAEFQLSLTE